MITLILLALKCGLSWFVDLLEGPYGKYVIEAIVIGGLCWYCHSLGANSMEAKYKAIIAEAQAKQNAADEKKAKEDREKEMQFKQESDEAAARVSTISSKFYAAQAAARAASKPSALCKSTPAVKDALNELLSDPQGDQK